MGRSLPSAVHGELHPTTSVFVLAAWIAAIIAITSAFCATHSKASKSEKLARRTSQASRGAQNNTEKPTTSDPTLQKSTERALPQEASQSELTSLYPLPLPQSRVVVPMIKSASSRHIRKSLSMKVPSTLSRIRTVTENRNKKGEDCIWKKTILLGERCRVPCADDEENTSSENRSGILPYRPRTPRSLPVSRSPSLIDPDSIPLPDS